MKKTSNAAMKTSVGVLGFLVVLCIAVAANVIVGNVRLRRDLTEDKLYVLSKGTHQILQNLPGTVTLKFYFNRSDPEVPVHIKRFADRVEDLLREYQLAGGKKIQVVKCDPQPDSDDEESAQRYGLSGQALGFMGPTLYMGLVAVMGDRDAPLAFIDPRTENLLEYNISRLIVQVSTPKKPVIGVVSSLPVLGDRRPPFAMPGQPESMPAWVVFRELRQVYDVREIPVPVDNIPDDVNTLVVIHPKNFADEALYAIDQFVLRGGNLAVFLDPVCMTEGDSPMMPQQMRMSAKSSNLPKLLEAWGVKYDPGKVLADLEAVSRIRMGANRVEDSLVWLSIRGDQCNKKDVLTSRLEAIMLPMAGCFAAMETKDLKVTPLITSSGSSAMMDAMMAQFGGDGLRRQFKSSGEKFNIALRLHGKLKTAFPEGKPEAKKEGEDKAKEGDKDKKEEKKDASPPGLKESKTTSNVILVGDVDMLYDRFCVQDINFMGVSGQQPINDNLAFFGSMMEQMAGGQALVEIRTRGRTERPFDVVLNLQRKAEERYMDEERQLQQKLEDAQRRLSEIESQKDKQQRFFLSAQQRNEIENFRAQVVETKKKLKLVRRKLREDIERLGVKVKVINILLMPAAVCLVGVGFGLYRRYRTKS